MSVDRVCRVCDVTFGACAMLRHCLSFTPFGNLNIVKTAGLICRSQVAGRRLQVAGHCFTNTESILNILKS